MGTSLFSPFMPLRFLLLAATFAGALRSQEASSRTFLLRGGTVHTISGPVIENGAILVRDGKITGVGKNLTAPEGVPVIDITGQQVYPGMIDSASLVSNPEVDFRAVSRVNGVTSVLAVPEGDLISGQLSLIHLDTDAKEATTLLPAAAVHLQFPALLTKPIPPHESEDDEEPQTAVAEQTIPYSRAKKIYDEQMRKLNAFFIAGRRYQHAKQTGRKSLKKDARLEMMIPVLDRTTPLFVTAVREREIREAIAFADKQKVRIVLADAYECYKVLDLIKAHNIAVVLGPTLSLPLDRDDPYDRSFTTPEELRKAGIKFSIATFGTKSVRNLPYQAAAAVPFGLPEEEAYKAVSLNAAEIFGVGKRLGSIDEGKTADLIVTDGDPLQANTHIKQMFLDGKPVDLATHREQLYQKYQTPAEKH